MTHGDLLRHGSERYGGEIGKASDDQHDADQQSYELRAVRRNRPGSIRFFCANEPATARSGIT